jgi:hypothetical protein
MKEQKKHIWEKAEVQKQSLGSRAWIFLSSNFLGKKTRAWAEWPGGCLSKEPKNGYSTELVIKHGQTELVIKTTWQEVCSLATQEKTSRHAWNKQQQTVKKRWDKELLGEKNVFGSMRMSC